MPIAPKRILNHLVELHRRKSLDAARALFDALGYQTGNELPLQTRTLSSGVRRLLERHTEPPVYLARHGDFRVVYTHITADRLLRAVERPVVEQTLRELHRHALFIFADRDLAQWDFVNARYHVGVGARRPALRRIHVGHGERFDVAARRISMLAVPTPDASAPVLQAIHDEAFDTHGLAEEFHNDYVAAFRALCNEISANNPHRRDDAEREAQLLIDRLLFLTFIEKKGWLEGQYDYVAQHLQAYRQADPEGTGYYTEFLLPLFVAMSTEGTGMPSLQGIPYLDGGLFDVSADAPAEEPLVIGNKVFRQVFDRVLGAYSVAARENTRYDVDVAVDPEMVGQVLESVVTRAERRVDDQDQIVPDSIPRGIVHFICREALAGYLASSSGIDSARIERLMDAGPAEQLTVEEVVALGGAATEPEARLLRALVEGARVLDPAVGSGAFLVGMLREMVALDKLLDVRLHGPERVLRRNYDYDRKRALIRRNLYGVDIRPEAVRICKLRLWLSLMVDYDREPGEPMPTLPDVSDHIRVGDSLVERLFDEPVQLDQLAEGSAARQLTDRIQEEKRAYVHESNFWEKRRRDLRILELMCDLGAELFGARRNAVLMRMSTDVPGLFNALGAGLLTERQQKVKEQAEAELAHYDDLLVRMDDVRQQARAMQTGRLVARAHDVSELKDQLGLSFNWRLDFAGVFGGDGGFDVVIGNPPGDRSAGLGADDKQVHKGLYDSATSGYDGSAVFVERGWRLLGPNGHLAFILPNRFLRSGAGRGLRRLLADERALKTIVDFRDPESALPVTSDNCLLFLTPGGNTRFRYLTVDDAESWLEVGGSTEEHELEAEELVDQGWEFRVGADEQSRG
jgi:hypothetical protein